MPDWLRYVFFVLSAAISSLCGAQSGVLMSDLHPSATLHQTGGVESTEIIDAWKWHTRADADFIFISGDEKRAVQPIYGMALGFGLPGRFELNMALPLGYSFGTLKGNGTDGGGFGDLRTGILYQIKGAPKGGAGILAGVFGYIPTGKADHLLGEGALALQPFLSVSMSSFSSSFTINVGYLWRPEHHAVLRNGSAFEQDDDVVWRVALRIPKDEDIAWSFLLNGTIGVATSDGVWPERNNRPVWVGGAIDFPVDDMRRIGMFCSFLASGGDSGIRLGVQISGVAKDRDEDRDGILLRDDQCPLLREDMDGFRDDDGCPDLDNDMDSFPDAEDACPLKKGDEFSMDGC